MGSAAEALVLSRYAVLLLPWLKMGAGHRPAGCERKRAPLWVQRGAVRGGKLLIKHAAARPPVLAHAMAPKAPRLVTAKTLLLER